MLSIIFNQCEYEKSNAGCRVKAGGSQSSAGRMRRVFAAGHASRSRSLPPAVFLPLTERSYEVGAAYGESRRGDHASFIAVSSQIYISIANSRQAAQAIDLCSAWFFCNPVISRVARVREASCQYAAAAGWRIRRPGTRSRPATAGEKTETVNPLDAVHECWNAKRRDLPPAQYTSPRGEHPSEVVRQPRQGGPRKRLCRWRECPIKPVTVDASLRAEL